MTVQEARAEETRATSTPESRHGFWAAGLVAVLCGVASLAALWAVAGRFPLMHDEHQFITPGILTLRDGMLPYRDYPLFHVPYQPLLNAFLLEIAQGDLYLGCRLPAAIAAWLTAVLVGWQGFLWLRPRTPSLGLAVAAAVAFSACLTPVTLRASSFAWNHQWPTLMMIVSLLLIFRLETRKSWLLAVLSGMAIGFSAGLRISFLPMFAPLGLAVLLLPRRTWAERFSGAAAFSAGAVLALLPCLWLLTKAPNEFMFGNFTYPKFSVPRKELPFWSEKTAKTVDPVRGYVGSEKVFKPKPLKNKIGYAKEQFLIPNGGLVGFAILVGVAGAGWAIWRRPEQRFRALVLLGGVPFLIWGSIAPSRFHQQYWYAPIPWLALLGLFGAYQLSSSRRCRFAIIGLTVLMLAGTAAGSSRFAKLFSVPRDEFFAVSGNLRRDESFAKLPEPVLTLHPTRFVAVGAKIYPELNSGEFGWRSAHLLPKSQREKLKLLCPTDLAEILSVRPPGSIAIGEKDDRMEAPLIQWAEENGYHARRGGRVYIAPSRAESPQPLDGGSSSSTAE